MTELLPVEYFHVVFTVPDVLHRLAVFNKELFYTLLFTAVKESLLEASANPKHLGGRIGFVAILHTWGQTLLVHPHIHCVVPGGGLSADGTRWMAAKKGFLVPVNVLAKLFRAKVLSSLKQAFQDNLLHPSGEETAGASSETFQQLVDKAYSKHWMVYAKKPFAGPMQVLRYVGKYTHRVAISNRRIVDVRENSVAFKWRDYRDAGSMKTMTLSAAEFMRRYLLHVIPKGFVRIRFYGMLSNRNKKEMLALSRKLLNETQGEHEDSKGQNRDSEEGIMTDIADGECFLCPECRKGHMFIVMVIDPEPFVNTKEELDSS